MRQKIYPTNPQVQDFWATEPIVAPEDLVLITPPPKIECESEGVKAFDLAVAKALVESKDEFPVDFAIAWQWIGYSKKENALRAFLCFGFVEGVDFTITHERVIGADKGFQRFGEGRKAVEYRLTTDCFKHFGMMAQTANGKKIRQYFLQCEKEYKKILLAKKADKFELQARKERSEFLEEIASLRKKLAALPPTPIATPPIGSDDLIERVTKVSDQADRIWATFGEIDPTKARSVMLDLLNTL